MSGHNMIGLPWKHLFQTHISTCRGITACLAQNLYQWARHAGAATGSLLSDVLFILQGQHGMFGLRTLYMSGHHIVGLPLDLYYLTNLQDLRVNDNRIKRLLPEIRNLSKLMV